MLDMFKVQSIRVFIHTSNDEILVIKLVTVDDLTLSLALAKSWHTGWQNTENIQFNNLYVEYPQLTEVFYIHTYENL